MGNNIDWQKLLLIFFIFFTPYQYWTNREQKHPPGILINQEPLQVDLNPLPKAWKFKKSVIQPLASYKIKSRLLSKKRYFFDSRSDYARYDLAVGWKTMSDSKLLSQLDISQGDRFYFYKFNRSDLNVIDMQTQSANMHIIPANDLVQKTVSNLRVGQIFEMTGSLVRVDFMEGGEWKSSLTRNDTGNGACEILWVESINVY